MKVSKYKNLYIIVIFSFLFFVSYLNGFYKEETSNHTKEDKFIIEKGLSKNQIIKILHEKGLISSSLRFAIFNFLHSKKSFKTGEYNFYMTKTENDIFKKISSGKTIQVKVSFIEGSTFNDILTEISNNSSLLKTNFNQSEIFKNFSNFYNENPEGLCFPDTYLFSNNSQDIDILYKCSNKMHDVLSKYWNKRSSGLPFKNMYEMLILASIIEKETSNHAEKRMISGVFINRLNQKMRLQSDPTVIYGIKDFDGNIKKKDLSEKNLYNTYRINGLPITPICSPGLESIIAASNPLRTKNLYFVSNNRGEHMFSETYEQHLEYVNKYQRGKD
tara:strand:+ start:287 stop:1279 length:993 start_codon:yes stop_codon:yes gene_type:complete